MTIQEKELDFINKAQSRISGLASEIASDLNESYDSLDKAELAIELSDVITSLQSEFNDWTDAEKEFVIDYYNLKADLNELAIIAFELKFNNTTDPDGSGGDNSWVPAYTALNAKVDDNKTETDAEIVRLDGRIDSLDFSNLIPQEVLDEIAANTNARHSHSNKDILDTIDQQFVDDVSASKTHTEDGTIHVTGTQKSDWDNRVTQQELTSGLGGKAELEHGHEMSDVNGLTEAFEGLVPEKGDPGTDGQTPVLVAGTATEGPLAIDIDATNPGEPVLNLTIPPGKDGEDFTIDEFGNAADRLDSAYNNVDAGYAYLGLDNGTLYFRNPYNDIGTFIPATSASGWLASQFMGRDGWSPVIGTAVLSDSKTVMVLVGWVGGSGTPPDLGTGGQPTYIGVDGFTQDPNKATNVKGNAGLKGDIGKAVFPDATDVIANRYLYDNETAEFMFLASESGQMFMKRSDAIGDWSSGYQWKGDKGDKGDIGPVGPSGEGSGLVEFPVINGGLVPLSKGSVVCPDPNTVITLGNSYIKDKSRLIAVLRNDILPGEAGVAIKVGFLENVDTSMFDNPGDIIYLGTSGNYVKTPPIDGGFVTIVGVVETISATTGSITVDTSTSNLTVEVTNTNGYPTDQKAKTTLSADEGTRTFTINTPDDFHYYELGEKFERTGNDSVVWTDQEGEHWFYYVRDVLTHEFNPTFDKRVSIVLNNAFTAAIYWNATDKVIVGDIQDERHGIGMSPVTHLYHHITTGARYVSGFSLGDMIVDGNGTSDTHLQLSVSAGVYFDEDITHNESGLAFPATIPVMYNLGVNAYVREGSIAGFSALNDGAGGRIYYNQNDGGDWKLTPCPDRDFCLYHIFGFNGQSVNTVSIMGQATYGTIGEARQAAATEVSNIFSHLPSVEMIPIATIIYEARDSYTNTLSARIRLTDDGNNYVDWTKTELSPGSPASSHANLTNVLQAGLGVVQGHVNEGLYNTINAGSIFRWDYNSVGTDTAPGANKFIIGADFINISNGPAGIGASVGNFLSALTDGSRIFLSKLTDPQVYLSLNVTGVPVAESGYYHIPITVHDADIALTDLDTFGFVFQQGASVGGGGAAETAIESAVAWDGSSYAISLAVSKIFKLTVNNLVSAATLALTFPADANTISREVVVEIDNSNNVVPISLITFDDNAGAYTWKWSPGTKPTGLAAGAKAQLYIYNTSNTEVKPGWEIDE